MHAKNEVNEKCMRPLTKLSITEYLKNVSILLKFIIINNNMKKETGLNCLRIVWESVL